jgi:hypothetical protein
MSDTANTIMRLIDRAEAGGFGTMSTGEKLAVAMVLNRPDLLGHWTMLEAADRLGPDWMGAAKAVQYELSKDELERASKAVPNPKADATAEDRMRRKRERDREAREQR